MAGPLTRDATGPVLVTKAGRQGRRDVGAGRRVAPAKARRYHRQDAATGGAAVAPQPDRQGEDGEVAGDVTVAPNFWAALWATWAAPLEGLAACGYVLNARIRKHQHECTAGAGGATNASGSTPSLLVILTG